jgi:polyphosphate kinase
MPRNFFRRIEVAFPIEDGLIVDRIVREILGVTLADNTKARMLGIDGTYRRVHAGRGEPARRSQLEFMELATASESAGSKRKKRGRYPEMKLAPRPFHRGSSRGQK